jgi:NADH-quinone oxidoreductase subunit A
MENHYLPILMITVASTGFAAVMLGANHLLGHKRPAEKMLEIKAEPFECGSVPIVAENRRRISVKFYLIALLFVLFDLEVVLLYPWAVRYRELGWFGFTELLVFLVSLVLGLAFAWRKGAFEWK